MSLRTVLLLHTLYARKEQSPKNALAPSLTAFVVCKLLEQYFPDFVDTQFTARMEDALDQIATGAANKTDYLSQYYCGDAGLLSQVTSTEESIPSDEARRAHLPTLTQSKTTCTCTSTN
eukprot:17445-Heterococcus_DN1.PRE.4